MQNLTKPVDKQDCFNRFVNHFIKEKHPKCYDAESDYCLYRDNSNGCAIGCMLPDNLYAPRMERQSVRELLSVYPGIKEWFSNIEQPFLEALQSLHDDCLGKESFNDHLKYIQDNYHLVMPE